MMQSRLRKRGRKGKWTYTHTIRKQVILFIASTGVIHVAIIREARTSCCRKLKRSENIFLSLKKIGIIHLRHPRFL